MLRFNNLKKLHKLIVRYYEEILGQDIESIPSVNLNAIAKDADTKDLLRLCQLVVALAVQSDNNNMYIEMIQSLTQKSQHALMVSIEEVATNVYFTCVQGVIIWHIEFLDRLWVKSTT